MGVGEFKIVSCQNFNNGFVYLLGNLYVAQRNYRVAVFLRVGEFKIKIKI